MEFKISYILKNKKSRSYRATRTKGNNIYLSTWTFKDTILHHFNLSESECDIKDFGFILLIDIINKDACWYGINITVHQLPQAVFMDVKKDGEEISSLKLLEKFDLQLKENIDISVGNKKRGIYKEFDIIKTYDDVSSHYCKLLYPKLDSFDRNLRLLLYNTYCIIYKKQYLRQFGFFSSGNRLKRKSKNKTDKRIASDNIFYEYDYSQLIDILFEKKSDGKTTWELYFASKIQGLDFENDIKQIKIFRDVIAHCKLISKEDYEKVSKLLDIYILAFDKAILLTYSKDFTREFSKEVHKSFERLSKLTSRLISKYSQQGDNML